MEMEQLPELERPNVIAAFQGWNDAGQAATTAVRYLVEAWSAKQFAHIDPDEYYSFTDTRPTIRIVEGTSRDLTWPGNEFFYFKGQGNSPAAVMMIGQEPNLKWRAFCGEIINLARAVNARRIVTLGALITESVHTRPVPLTGFSTDSIVQNKLISKSITRSSYEGPTGIVGVLHSACINAEMPTASLWAGTPYYLGSTPNPKTALGLLESIDDLLELNINLNELKAVAEEFERQVSMAVHDNAEIQERIQSLEQAFDASPTQQPPPQFPPTGALIDDLEQFLRRQREEGT
ncbi:MAG: PAC2 family protein [Dehalococcoidia bacterium]